jgi:CRISPR-associated protein Csx14
VSIGHVLISPLSTEPQGVIWLLDWLLEQEYPIQEVCVIHTQADIIRIAAQRLSEEFGVLYPSIRPRFVPLERKGGTAVEDIVSDEDTWVLLGAFYREIRLAKRAGQTVHLSLVSGRKTMAVYGMVAAQLLFDEQDHVWHMISKMAWQGGKKRLHPTLEGTFQVIAVPVIRWADAATVRLLLDGPDDPWEAIHRQQEFASSEKQRRRREFWQHYLTPAQRQVVELLVREGLDNVSIARRLGKSERTIANQLSQVYRSYQEWRGVPATRATLIAELATLLGDIDSKK